MPDGYIGGVNLAEVSDNNRNIISENVLFTARPWVSQPYPYGAGPWDDGRTWTSDSDGNPTSLAADQQLATVILHNQAGNYPDGTYVLKYEGTADFDFYTDATVGTTAPGRIELSVTLNKEIIIKVRNVSSDFKLLGLYTPGNEDVDGFTQDFLDSLQLFGFIRFMDWGQTNNSAVVDWEDYAPPTYWTMAHENGVPIKVMCDLCNTVERDMWICVPHQATDLCVQNIAATIRDNLDPQLNVYVEYSNETWNGVFDQTDYCIDRGQDRGLDLEDIYRGGLRFYAERSGEVFEIFQKVLTPHGFNITRILASQSTTTWRGELVMDWDKATQSEQPLTVADRCDVYAVAPYFGNNVDGNGKTTAQILSECDTDSSTKHSTNTATNASNASTRGVELWAYEGGQHLVGSNDTERNNFITANQDAGMETVYYDDLTRWKANGGGKFTFFTHTWAASEWDGSPRDSGAWGITEYQSEWDTSTPKLDAITQWIGEENTLVQISEEVIRNDHIKVLKFAGMSPGSDTTSIIDTAGWDYLFLYVEDPGNTGGTAANNPSVAAKFRVLMTAPGVTYTATSGGLFEERTNGGSLKSERADLTTSGSCTPGFLAPLPGSVFISTTGTHTGNGWDLYVVLGRGSVNAWRAAEKAPRS